MSQRAIEFTAQWIAENVYTGPYALENQPHPEALTASERLVRAAEAAGITRKEIEEDLGDLEDFLSEQFEEATDAEVDRIEDEKAESGDPA